jgi:predicted metal-dependent peptidase
MVDLENLLLKAKIELMTKAAFISTICLSVRHIITEDVPTAATNNLNVYYNPHFIAKLTVAQLAGLIAHECWHIAYQHILRRGDREPTRWNCAGDFKINYMLRKAGYELPEGGLYDEKYDDDWSTDSVYGDLEDTNFDPDPGTMILDITGDAPGAGGTPKEVQTKITDILVRAHTQAKLAGLEAGEIPAEILRVIDELLNPKVPWPVVLQKFLDRRTRDQYSWSRRNRRFSPYMPSLYNYGLGHLTWGIDTSGSQDDDDLRSTLSEIKGVRDTFNPEHMTIIDCDSKIHNVYEIDAHADIMSLDFNGGGGTSFKPVLNYVEEHPTQALIYFTDLYGERNLAPVDYPILWICNSNHPPANIGETVYIDP